MSEDEISLGMPADPPPLRSPGINRIGDDFAFSANSSFSTADQMKEQPLDNKR
jgi:hypothetical protein